MLVAEGANVPKATLDKAEQQEVTILSSGAPVYETVAGLVSLGI